VAELATNEAGEESESQRNAGVYDQTEIDRDERIADDKRQQPLNYSNGVPAPALGEPQNGVAVFRHDGSPERSRRPTLAVS